MPVMDDNDARKLRGEWSLPDDVTFLNHGSFGPTPLVVQQARAEWSARLASEPMNFFLREMEPALDEALARLAQFLDADPRDMVFSDNATTAMNTVADSVPLAPGDEVLLNDHEYGAVRRIWQRACDRQQAKLVSTTIPVPIRTVDDVLEPLFAAVTERTKLIVVSHVTSPTAIVFPVEQISQRAKALDIPVCVDSPHAIAMRDVSLRKIGAAFYCASLHKWLSAPLGTGFLYVARRWQSRLRPTNLSWGRSLAGRPGRWQDEWNWIGTRDPAGFLAVPAAIDFLQRVGLDRFREHGHGLVQSARQQIEALCGTESLIPDDPVWYGTMITIPLPAGPSLRPSPNSWDPWTQAMWERYRIEVPVVDWRGRRHLRVSCHLYNTREDLRVLMGALRELLKELT